jgi:hypothetical protein
MCNKALDQKFSNLLFYTLKSQNVLNCSKHCYLVFQKKTKGGRRVFSFAAALGLAASQTSLCKQESCSGPAL